MINTTQEIARSMRRHIDHVVLHGTLDSVMIIVKFYIP